ncbi:EF-hand domain-containing protein [Plasmodiophora brassicae]|uniref:EF-hand domain-containing protein n=1 Tax=Plasmodiophora brassicae TaxID=37360 RepID=A0A3P3YKS9_PLABS|nr:unnamed protein product [Plasmodiophora brassicae]
MSSQSMSAHHRDPAADLRDTLESLLSSWRLARRKKSQFSNRSHDPFMAHLQNLEASLGEMKIWDSVLIDMSDRPEFCGGSTAAAALVGILRRHLKTFSMTVEMVLCEIRRRLAFDWTLAELSHKKSAIRNVAKVKLEQLQRDVENEAAKADRWEKYVKSVKASLENTTHVLNFAEVSENDSCAVDDGATRKAVVASSDGGTFREVKQPILRDLGDAPALTIDTHLVEGLPVQVTRLTSGMRVIRTCTTNSAFFSFEISKNIGSGGVSLLLTQSPAGDKVNYIQLLLNRDNVPTTLMKTHQVRTRGSKYAFLQLSSREMQPGMWFMKVTGIGLRLKTFSLEFRASIDVSSEALGQSDVLTSMLNEVEEQQSIALKLDALESVSVSAARKLLDRLAVKANYKPASCQTRSFTKAELVSPPKIDRGPLGGFEPLLTLPTPDASKLRRPSLRATLKTVIELYFDRINQMSLAATPNSEALVEPSICQFIYKEFVSKYGVVKLAEHNIVELVYVVKTRRWLSVPRIVMFGRLCGIINTGEGNLGNEDFAFVTMVVSTIKKCIETIATPSNRNRLDDIDGHIVITKQIAQAVIDSIFSNDTLLFRTAVFKQAVSRTQDTSKAARHHETVDGDVLIECIHRQWRQETATSDLELRSLFSALDFDESGWIDFSQFLAAFDMLQAVENAPTMVVKREPVSSLDIFNVYNTMIDASLMSAPGATEPDLAGAISTKKGHRKREFMVSVDGFIDVCHSVGLVCKSYARARIPAEPTDGSLVESQLPPINSKTDGAFRRSQSSSSVSSMAASTSSWNQLLSNWRQVEPLIMSVIGHVRQRKFAGHDDVWQSLNRVKTEVRLRRDLSACQSSLFMMMDTICEVLRNAPIVLTKQSDTEEEATTPADSSFA